MRSRRPSARAARSFIFCAAASAINMSGARWTAGPAVVCCHGTRRMPERSRLDEVLSQCAAGELPARVAAMHLLMEAESPEAARRAVLRVRAAGGAGHLHELESLLADHPQAWAMVRAILAKVQHRPSACDSVTRWAGLFDAAVRIS